MVLVDTSVWIAHLREGNIELKALLEDEEVLCHPFIVGELACGHMQNREEILSLLYALPMAPTAGHEEILRFIESQQLMGAGLGLIDVHLLAAALLSRAPLWTYDRSLKKAAAKLSINYPKNGS